VDALTEPDSLSKRVGASNYNELGPAALLHLYLAKKTKEVNLLFRKPLKLIFFREPLKLILESRLPALLRLFH